MVLYWVVFCDIIREVFLYLLLEYAEMILSYSDSDPIKSHIYCYGPFCFDVPFTMMFAAALSVSTGAGGCNWPISARPVCIDVAF